MLTKDPNPAHLAIAECEERLSKQGRKVTVITQNIDELHHRAGSKNILEIHGEQRCLMQANKLFCMIIVGSFFFFFCGNTGSLFKTRCMTCGHEAANYKSPICAALEGKG